MRLTKQWLTKRWNYAAGNGGQCVLVLPDLDRVVGITGGDYAERTKFFPWESQLVPQYIIPAALAGENPKP